MSDDKRQMRDGTAPTMEQLIELLEDVGAAYQMSVDAAEWWRERAERAEAPPQSRDGEDEWTLRLNRYQRDNLLWLLQLCGRNGITPFTSANTGDWLGELTFGLVLGPDPKPNIGAEDFAKSIAPREAVDAGLVPSDGWGAVFRELKPFTPMTDEEIKAALERGPVGITTTVNLLADPKAVLTVDPGTGEKTAGALVSMGPDELKTFTPLSDEQIQAALGVGWVDKETVSQEDYNEIVERVKNPRQPTEELRNLMFFHVCQCNAVPCVCGPSSTERGPLGTTTTVNLLAEAKAVVRAAPGTNAELFKMKGTGYIDPANVRCGSYPCELKWDHVGDCECEVVSTDPRTPGTLERKTWRKP